MGLALRAQRRKAVIRIRPSGPKPSAAEIVNGGRSPSCFVWLGRVVLIHRLLGRCNRRPNCQECEQTSHRVLGKKFHFSTPIAAPTPCSWSYVRRDGRLPIHLRRGQIPCHTVTAGPLPVPHCQIPCRQPAPLCPYARSAPRSSLHTTRP